MAARDDSRRDAEYEDIARGDAARGDAERSGAAGGDGGRGDAERSGAGRGDGGRGDAERSGAGRGDGGRGDAGRSGAGRGDGGRGDAGRSGAGRGDAGREDAEHSGAARGDAARGDAGPGDAARGDAGRGDAGRGEVASDRLAVDGAERDGLAHGGGRNAGPAYDDHTHDGPAYAGMDALMAALLDEPLPEEALRDAEFVASRDAAAADVALLREQLGLIGEALAVPGEDAVAGAPPGRPVAARPGDAAGAETDSGHVPGPAPAPVASVRPLLPRPSRARRALKITFGTLAAAAAASVVLGVGWAVVQAGGGANVTSSDSGAAEKSASQGEGGLEDSDGGDGSPSLSREGYVACARLIVEGTVTEVEPETGVRQDRITVEVDRWIKPDKGEDRIDFPLDHDAEPRLKKGDHVLVSIPRGSAQPDIWTTKEAEIARDRAWIEAALPGSERLACD